MKKLLVGLLMVPCMAQAEFETGNTLLADLQASGLVSRAVALGYIKGVADVYMHVTFCPPGAGSGITAGQVQDIVRNYLEINPAIRHKTAESIINDALKKTWPCANNNNRGRI